MALNEPHTKVTHPVTTPVRPQTPVSTPAANRSTPPRPDQLPRPLAASLDPMRPVPASSRPAIKMDALICESTDVDRASDTKEVLRQNVSLVDESGQHVKLVVSGAVPFLFEVGARYSFLRTADAPQAE